jgi:hypothetical protein
MKHPARKKDEREDKTVGLVRWIFENGQEIHKSSASLMMECVYWDYLENLDEPNQAALNRFNRPC